MPQKGQSSTAHRLQTLRMNERRVDHSDKKREYEKSVTFAESVEVVTIPDSDFDSSFENSVLMILTNGEELKTRHGRFKTLGAYSQLLERRATLREDGRSTYIKPSGNLTPELFFCLIDCVVVGRFGAYYQGYEREVWKPRTFKIFRNAIFKDRGSALERQILSLNERPYSIPKLITSFSYQLKKCLVLEHLKVESLKEKLLFCRRFPQDVVLCYMSQMVLVTSFLHTKGIIHRNLTPDAFWIQSNGHLKLTDFSLCITSDSFWARYKPHCMPLDYRAPETFQLAQITRAVDIWSLGVMLYKMTSGRLPFYSCNKKALIESIREKNVVFSEIFSEETADLCRKLLEKNPKVRLADEEVTFYIFSAHRFFESVNWNRVLRGKDHVPQIPLLVSAIKNETSHKLHLNLRQVDENAANKMKIKPLLYQELSTKDVKDIFDSDHLEKLHLEQLVSDLKPKLRRIRSAIHKERKMSKKKYSFQEVGDVYELVKSVSPSDTPSFIAQMRDYGNRKSTPSSSVNMDNDLTYLCLRISLENTMSEVLARLETDMKDDKDPVSALSELQHTLNKHIHQLKKAMKHEFPSMKKNQKLSTSKGKQVMEKAKSDEASTEI